VSEKERERERERNVFCMTHDQYVVFVRPNEATSVACTWKLSEHVFLPDQRKYTAVVAT
jgi:hypothetical protein